jgi:hypothetical protein
MEEVEVERNLTECEGETTVRPLQFLHVTKSGGSSIEAYGRRHGLKWGRYFKGLSGPLLPPHTGRLRSEPHHIPPKYFEQNPYQDFDVFVVLRDPSQRAISEFRCPWKGFKAPARTAQARDARKGATQRDLNSWLLSKVRKGGMEAPFRNGHLIPYSEYLLDDRGERALPRERILRFDHLEEDFRSLCSDRHLPMEPLALLNTSEMPRFQVEDLDEEVVHALRRAYEKDYALFESLR